MKTDLNRRLEEMGPLEKEDLRKHIREGLIGGILALLIGAVFVWIFYTSVPQGTPAGRAFVRVPLALIAGILIFILSRIYKYQRDLKFGFKEVVRGEVQRMYIKTMTNADRSTIRNLSERTRHFIVVNKQAFLVKSTDYDDCEPGCFVEMSVAKYSGRVFDFKVLTLRDNRS